MKKKILVSQPQPSSEKSPYYDIASRFDVEMVFRPFIKVEGLTAKEFRQQRINIHLAPRYRPLLYAGQGSSCDHS